MEHPSERTRQLFWSAFWDGMAAAFLFSPPPSLTKSDRPSDMEALRGDWRRIGNDFRVSISKTSENPTRKAA